MSELLLCENFLTEIAMVTEITNSFFQEWSTDYPSFQWLAVHTPALPKNNYFRSEGNPHSHGVSVLETGSQNQILPETGSQNQILPKSGSWDQTFPETGSQGQTLP